MERSGSSQCNYAARKRPSSEDGTTGRAKREERLHVAQRERQLILTFLSENQSVVIPEAACVISSLPHPAPSPAGFRSLLE